MCGSSQIKNFIFYRPTSEKPKKGGLFKRNTGKENKEQSEEKSEKNKGLVHSLTAKTAKISCRHS